MMTKWDTIQADLEPITPSYWLNDEDDEAEDLEISLDELFEDEEELVLEWEGLE